MKRKLDQNGLIPMLVCILIVVVGIIVLAYMRVQSQN